MVKDARQKVVVLVVAAAAGTNKGGNFNVYRSGWKRN